MASGRGPVADVVEWFPEYRQRHSDRVGEGAWLVAAGRDRLGEW